MNQLVKDIDSTYCADYKMECENGTYYVYVENNALIPEFDLQENIASIKASVEDAVKLERYLKKYYNASVSLKVVNSNTKEIYVVDTEDVYDYTNIFSRLKVKFFELIGARKQDKKSKGNFFTILFVSVIFLSGSINLKGDTVGNAERFWKFTNYSHSVTHQISQRTYRPD